MPEETHSYNFGTRIRQDQIGKIFVGTLTMLAAAWMIDSIRILYDYAPVVFWHFNFWNILFGSAWRVFFDPIGPVDAYMCYCVTHANAVFAPSLVILDAALIIIYGGLIFRDRELPSYQRWLWFIAIAISNLLLVPLIMPIYFFIRLMPCNQSK